MIFRLLTLPFSAVLASVYRLALIVDRFRKSARRKWLSRPVISIGNLSLGGTGKTPLLIHIIGDLQSRGVRPAILSRGYRGFRNSGSLGVVIGDQSLELANDEIRLLAKKYPTVPIGVGPDRFASAQKILASHPVDVFLLDDGFQHWALSRDADLVCVDGTDPFAGGFVLPLGRLREPLSALSRASAVIVTRSELQSPKARTALQAKLSTHLPPEKIIFSSFEFSLRHISGQAVDLLVLKNRTVMAFSAIGNPSAFEKNLEEFGARVLPRRFTDHHSFTELEIQSVLKEAHDVGALVVITEKDAVKINLRDESLYVLEASLNFSDSDRDHWGRLLHDLSNLALRP